MTNLDKLQELTDKYSRGEISSNDLVSHLTNTSSPLPSDEDIIKVGDELNKSLTPETLVLNDDDINDLLCQYEGEELGNRMLWKILDKLGLSKDIKDLPDFSSNSAFDKFFESKKITDRLQRAKEMLSDNLDLDLIGIKFKGANLKTRNFGIAGFNFPINIITHKGTPLFFHIAPSKYSISKILDLLKKKAKSNKKKKCADDFSKKYKSPVVDSDKLISDLEKLLAKEKQEREYNNVFDLADDLFCEPEIAINPETGEPLFNKDDLKSFLQEICLPETESNQSEAITAEPIEDISNTVNSCLNQAKSIFTDVREKNEEKSRLQKAEKELEEILFHYEIVQNYYNGLYNLFQSKSKGSSNNVTISLKLSDILSSDPCNRFINSINSFSSRLKLTSKMLLPGQMGYTGIKFEIQFPHGLGKSIPYERIKNNVNNELLNQDYQRVDITKLQLGMEFSDQGVFAKNDSKFLKDFEDFLIFKDENPKNNKDYYAFVNDVENTSKSKSQIISEINFDHGYLYSNLIEVSASPWLFFNSSERGDNDARKQADIKPASTDKDGQPNKEFSNFWGDFKTSWDKKYSQKKKDIEDRIKEIKSISDTFISLLVDYYIANQSSASNNLTLLKNASDGMDQRVSVIHDLLMTIGQRITKLDSENSADTLSNRASSIKCSTAVPANLSVPCPSDCCGPAGQAIDQGDLSSFSDSPDCPNLFTQCYWKAFSKKLNTVGTLPLPNGLPPIESPAMLAGNIGLKYWPVGYLPPSFIPLPPPIVNPLDGLPFIRIPMPMVWTKVDPIVIPVGIGVIVIFIPFIGGFMPSPLVFFHDFLTQSSIFLLGMRGFRFIPRKSDPVFPDPLENYKQFLTRGIPNFLFPFDNLGKDNVDSPIRLFKEIKDNIEKRLANVNKNVDFSKIQKVQDKISAKKKDAEAKILEKKRKAALEKVDLSKDQKEIDDFVNSLNNDKKEAIKSTIKDYLKSAVDLPDLQFPKQSKNLIIDIPSALKVITDLNAKVKLGVIPELPPKPLKINLTSKILNAVSDLSFSLPSELDGVNSKLSNDSKIVAKFDVPLGEITKDKDSIKQISQLITNSVGEVLTGENSPLKSKKLLSFKPKISIAPRVPGAGVPIPSSSIELPNPVVESAKAFITSNIKIDGSKIESLANSLLIGGNKVLRQRDLKLMIKSTLNDTIKKFPVNLGNLSIPDPASIAGLTTQFAAFSASVEFPGFPPKKSALPAAPVVPGGIPPIVIPGSVISSFLVDGATKALDSIDYNLIVPGGLANFENLTANDIKSMSNNLIKTFTKTAKIPAIDSLPSIPIPARPQDNIEFTMNFLPVHPFSDIAFTLLWTKFKMPPRVPIPGEFLQQYLKIQSAIFSKVPWPVTVVLGRNVINLLNPLWNKEDIPRWDRMSLKNPFFVVFVDEFLRSAADISGGFKYFLGAGNLFYPLPDSEINLGFGTKITVN